MTTTVLSTIPTSPATLAPAAAASDAALSTEATQGENVVSSTGKEAVEAALDGALAPPEESKPDPDLEIARKLDLVAKREARARKQEADIQAKMTALSEQESSLSKLRSELEAALEDPVDYFLKKGKDPTEIVKRFAKPMTEEEKRLAKLEEAERKREEDAKKREEDAKKSASRAEQERIERAFVAGTMPDEYPHLTTMYKPQEVPHLVRNLLHGPHDPRDPNSPTVLQVFKAKHNRLPNDQEIREALEQNAKIRATELMSRLGPKTQVAPSQATPSTPQASEESTSLSNHHASSSSSATPRTESREERMKRLKEELEAEASTT